MWDTMTNNNESILKNADFAYMQKRMLWISVERRRAFSDESIQDHDGRWLASKLSEDVPEGEFRFYSNSVWAPEVKMEVLEELGLTGVIPT